MKTIAVLQNTASEHLGNIEDHLEGRNIRFRYVRPANDPDWEAKMALPNDGLIVLGAAPYGTVSLPVVYQLDRKIKAVQDCLNQKLPIVAFGTGTQILLLAAECTVSPSPLELNLQMAYKHDADALGGYLPDQFPVVTYMRDLPELPGEAKILAKFADDRPAVFQLFSHCLGFVGHPGIKGAIIEDSLVQFPDIDIDASQALEELRSHQRELETSLSAMMTGIIQITGWMQ